MLATASNQSLGRRQALARSANAGGTNRTREEHHVDLNRIIDRAEMQLEQYALHVQGLANDGRQTLIAQAEFQQELDALIRLQAYRRKSI